MKAMREQLPSSQLQLDIACLEKESEFYSHEKLLLCNIIMFSDYNKFNVNRKKEEEELMKLHKQEALQLLKKKEKTDNIIKKTKEKKQKKKQQNADPNKPKKPAYSYFTFSKEARISLMQERPGINNSTLNVLVSLKLKELREKDKQMWNAIAIEAMGVYKKELEEYNNSVAASTSAEQ